MKKRDIVTAGFAMFVMMFGAGNIVYPLVLGRSFGTNVGWALIGFCITAAFVPLLGFIATLLCGGDYRLFLGRVGKGPALLITFVCMVLLGPFCAIPRCIMLAHSVIKWYVPAVSLFLFSLATGILIFACTVKKELIVSLLSSVFGPIKLALLSIIIIAGLLSNYSLVPSDSSAFDSLYRGFVDGYGTMDLLGTIFFAGLIAAGMKLGSIHKGTATVKEVVGNGLKVGGIGCGLLVIVYVGFGLVSARYASMVVGVSKTELFSALSSLALGTYGGIIASLTIFITCFTTAIVLSAIFADYVKGFFFARGQGYLRSLGMTVLLSCVMASLGFQSIMDLVEPVIIVFYPGLIFLSIINIIYVLFIDKRSKRKIIASIVDANDKQFADDVIRRPSVSGEQRKEM